MAGLAGGDLVLDVDLVALQLRRFEQPAGRGDLLGAEKVEQGGQTGEVGRLGQQELCLRG